jgi:hypothetical protein
MTERQVEIDQALANAAECDLIGNLAADPDTRKAYRDMAEGFRTAARSMQKQQSQDNQCRARS